MNPRRDGGGGEVERVTARALAGVPVSYPPAVGPCSSGRQKPERPLVMSPPRRRAGGRGGGDEPDGHRVFADGGGAALGEPDRMSPAANRGGPVLRTMPCATPTVAGDSGMSGTLVVWLVMRAAGALRAASD